MTRHLLVSLIVLCSCLVLNAKNQNGNNDPKSMETQSSGTGLFLETIFSPKMQGGLEIGYLFNSSSYKRRLGISIEYLAFQEENTLYNRNSIAFSPKGSITGLKIIACTPIFPNSISISGYAKPVLVIPSSSNYNGAKYFFAYGLGWEVDFWLKDGSCFYMGLKGERAIKSKGNNDFYPAALRSTFGVKIFLSKIRFRSIFK